MCTSSVMTVYNDRYIVLIFKICISCIRRGSMLYFVYPLTCNQIGLDLFCTLCSLAYSLVVEFCLHFVVYAMYSDVALSSDAGGSHPATHDALSAYKRHALVCTSPILLDKHKDLAEPTRPHLQHRPQQCKILYVNLTEALVIIICKF